MRDVNGPLFNIFIPDKPSFLYARRVPNSFIFYHPAERGQEDMEMVSVHPFKTLFLQCISITLHGIVLKLHRSVDCNEKLCRVEGSQHSLFY